MKSNVVHPRLTAYSLLMQWITILIIIHYYIIMSCNLHHFRALHSYCIATIAYLPLIFRKYYKQMHITLFAHCFMLFGNTFCYTSYTRVLYLSSLCRNPAVVFNFIHFRNDSDKKRKEISSLQWTDMFEYE